MSSAVPTAFPEGNLFWCSLRTVIHRSVGW
jgi:hypothetical protein